MSSPVHIAGRRGGTGAHSGGTSRMGLAHHAGPCPVAFVRQRRCRDGARLARRRRGDKEVRVVLGGVFFQRVRLCPRKPTRKGETARVRRAYFFFRACPCLWRRAPFGRGRCVDGGCLFLSCSTRRSPHGAVPGGATAARSHSTTARAQSPSKRKEETTAQGRNLSCFFGDLSFALFRCSSQGPEGLLVCKEKQEPVKKKERKKGDAGVGPARRQRPLWFLSRSPPIGEKRDRVKKNGLYTNTTKHFLGKKKGAKKKRTEKRDDAGTVKRGRLAKDRGGAVGKKKEETKNAALARHAASEAGGGMTGARLTATRKEADSTERQPDASTPAHAQQRDPPSPFSFPAPSLSDCRASAGCLRRRPRAPSRSPPSP